MKKKLLALLLVATAACAAVGFSACGNTEADKFVQKITNVTQAYNVATELGYDGTMDQFVTALDGKDGAALV